MSSSSSSSSQDAQIYNQCASRGHQLLTSMSTQTGESHWNGSNPTAIFRQYGYTNQRDPGVLPSKRDKETLYHDLGVSLSTNRWAIMNAHHRLKFRIQDRDYQATGTSFKIHMNAQDGVLEALSSWGLDISLDGWAKLGQPLPELPDPMLKTWSDCAYLMWKKECQEQNKTISNVKYIFQEKVTNDTTNKVLDVILAKRGKARYSLDKWPGIRISTESDYDGMALLGSPNGYGPAYFLAQHQAELGRKKITEVRVWKNGNHPDLLFCVTPA